MEIRTLLLQKRTPIIRRWFDLILEAYPSDTANFLKEEQDRFANPAGYIISRGLETLFDELTRETDSANVITTLDSIIRIRAVQDFNTFQALTFVFLLKKAMREELEGEMKAGEVFFDYLSFESRIDSLSLFAFDIYVKAREEVYRARVREIAVERDRAFRILKMMGHEGDAS
jgi:hypothetical protein